MSSGVRIRAASDRSLIVYFGDKVTLRAHNRVRKFLRLLETEPIAGVRNLHPAYCSVMVDFDAVKWTHGELEKILRRHLRQMESFELSEPREVEIPACYGGEFGPDLEEVARLQGSSAERVIELHASVTYVVYFLGFVPGFAYLGVLPKALETPRLTSPRRSTPPGSVGIAGNHTAVYPFATPGGWRLIGRTPIAMFRPERGNMSLLNIGDRVRFKPISAERFAELKNE